MSRINELTENVQSLEDQVAKSKELLYILTVRFEALLLHLEVEIGMPLERRNVKEK